MGDPVCTLQVWADPPRGIIKITGRATATAAPDFIAVIDRLRARGNTCFALELSSCTLMDSTFVGHLANLALSLPAPGSTPAAATPHRILLVNPGPHITDLLDTIYVLDLFDVLQNSALESAQAETIESHSNARPRQEIQQCCLDAHRVLAALAPENAAKFQDVIRYLEQSAQPPQAPPPPPPQ